MDKTSAESISTLLQKQREISVQFQPVIFSMVIIGLAGIIGNSLAIVFYSKRSKITSTVMLIICLAVVDLIVCVLIIPSILELAVNLTYYQSFMCKLSHFSARWAISTSCVIIWMISMDRYQKVCNPFGKQITVLMIKKAMIVIAVITFVFSVKNFFTFDNIELNLTNTDNNETITGRFCTAHRDQQYGTVISVFYVIDAVFSLTVFLTLLFTYSNVIYTLIKLRRKIELKSLNTGTQNDRLSKRRAFKQLVVVDYNYSSASEPRSTLDIFGLTRYATITSLNNHSYGRDMALTRQPEAGKQIRTKCKINDGAVYFSSLPWKWKQCTKTSSKRTSTERSLSIMMLAVSLVYILCFMPYFATRIAMRNTDYNDETELNTLVQFLLRLVYINSVSNPIIYCIFNPKFRTYIKGLFTY